MCVLETESLGTVVIILEAGSSTKELEVSSILNVDFESGAANSETWANV
jgi:hypothetical protein